MSLSNWCVLFMTLFLGVILLPDLKEQYVRNAQVTMEVYNRNLDQATEDALMDSLTEEFEDGSIAIYEKGVLSKFTDQVCLDFDVVTREERAQILELLKLQQLVNQRGKPTRIEKEKLREMMEQTINDNSKLKGLTYALLLPITEKDHWSNSLENNSFYTFLEIPDVEKYPWTRLFATERVRFSFSGAKVIKKAED